MYVYMFLLGNVILGEEDGLAKKKSKRMQQELEENLRRAEQKTEKYRKRLLRLKKANPSPRSAVSRMLREASHTSVSNNLFEAKWQLFLFIYLFTGETVQTVNVNVN